MRNFMSGFWAGFVFVFSIYGKIIPIMCMHNCMSGFWAWFVFVFSIYGKTIRIMWGQKYGKLYVTLSYISTALWISMLFVCPIVTSIIVTLVVSTLSFVSGMIGLRNPAYIEALIRSV